MATYTYRPVENTIREATTLAMQEQAEAIKRELVKEFTERFQKELIKRAAQLVSNVQWCRLNNSGTMGPAVELVLTIKTQEEECTE